MIGLLNLYVNVHAYSAVHERTIISLMELGPFANSDPNPTRHVTNLHTHTYVHMYVQWNKLLVLF